VIDELHLQRFKGHRDTNVRLGTMTLLVGPNGSGKTSALEALDALGRTGEGSFPWREPRLWYEAHVHRGDRGQVAMGARGTVGDVPTRVTLSLGPIATPSGELIEGVAWTDRAGPHDAKGGYPADLPSSEGGRLVQGAVLLRPDATRIATPSLLRSPTPTIEADGYGTASVLATIRLRDLAAFERIEALVRRVSPAVESIKVETAQAGDGVGFRVTFNVRGAADLPAHAASAGTLVTLALATALHAAPSPRLLLLDEVDHSLHPKAQLELVRQLRALVDARDDLQIVATTHSPYVLDAFALDEVRVFAQRTDGSVAVKELREHPEAARLREVLSPAQLWSLDDEASWVVGAAG
jgi:ABC-type branched-subunit amino acid transport system ATPase component